MAGADASEGRRSSPAGSPVTGSSVARSFSSDPWTDQACHTLLDDALPRILGALERHRPGLVVLGGSAALGEAVGWSPGPGGGSRFLLSDLDISVVTRHPVDAATRRRLIAELNREDGPAGDLSPDLPPVTLGLYESSWLERQDPTPGLLDLKNSGLCLWGDARLLRRFVTPPPNRLKAWEALRLVGNRALELLRAPEDGSPSSRARRLHALAKAVTGLWTARLLQEGRYRSGWKEQEAVLVEAPGDDPVAASARIWAPFRTAPAERRLPPPEQGLPLYRAALTRWLETSAVGCEGEPESIWLGDPGSLHTRAILWRMEVQRLRETRSLRTLWPRIPWAAFSAPEGGRMAAAVLYWRLLPERPEPVWGDRAPEPLGFVLERVWRRRTRRYLGREVAPGPGCRRRLRVEIGPGTR